MTNETQQPTWPELPERRVVYRGDRNGMGTAGFVLALLGVIVNPLALAALPMSIAGLSRARRGEATNGSVALAGIVLAGFVWAFWIVVLVMAAADA